MAGACLGTLMFWEQGACCYLRRMAYVIRAIALWFLWYLRVMLEEQKSDRSWPWSSPVAQLFFAYGKNPDIFRATVWRDFPKRTIGVLLSDSQNEVNVIRSPFELERYHLEIPWGLNGYYEPTADASGWTFLTTKATVTVLKSGEKL